jgi:hypothetical protein
MSPIFKSAFVAVALIAQPALAATPKDANGCQCEKCDCGAGCDCGCAEGSCDCDKGCDCGHGEH